MLDGSTYPSLKLVHYVFGKINYGGLKCNSLYLGLVLPSSGWQSLIMIENVTPQFEAYIMMVIYDCKYFIEQSTEQGLIYQNIID